MKPFFQYVAIFFNFSSTSSHLHQLQVENCDSNSRLVVDEDDNGKFRLERVLKDEKYFLNNTWKSRDVQIRFQFCEVQLVVARNQMLVFWWDVSRK